MTVQAMRCKADEVVSWMGQSLADAKVLQQRPESPEPTQDLQFCARHASQQGQISDITLSAVRDRLLSVRRALLRIFDGRAEQQPTSHPILPAWLCGHKV